MNREWQMLLRSFERILPRWRRSPNSAFCAMVIMRRSLFA
jgi:hypothetical protein